MTLVARIVPTALLTLCLSLSAVAQPGPAGQVQTPGQKHFTPHRDRALAFLKPYGIENFSQHYIDALQTFDAVETLYYARQYQQAKARLDALWSKYPVSALSWQRLPGQQAGINIGTPPCYYALRMLTDMVAWRLEGGDAVITPDRTVRLTVLVAQSAAGLQPRNLGELQAGTGVQVTHTIDARLGERDHRVVRQSVRLFNEYVVAMTRGRLGVETQILPVETELAVQAGVFSGTTYYAGLTNAGEIWSAIPQSVQDATDWWLLTYPSHVPDQYPDFETAEFITGGMGFSPAGGPLFIADDRWVLRKPPHLGSGDYTNIERRAYLPQWMQHEFFHHLFARYPQFGLEAESHQWFDRNTWPPDFEGRFEPDYYHEALAKRLQSAEPPLHVALRYATGGAPYDQLQLDDVLGDYTRHPAQNDWHTGTIRIRPNGQMRWRNTANVFWNLYPELAEGRLGTGPDCPYYNSPGGQQFLIELDRNEVGDWVPTVRGFRFNGELYTRDAP